MFPVLVNIVSLAFNLDKVLNLLEFYNLKKMSCLKTKNEVFSDLTNQVKRKT